MDCSVVIEGDFVTNGVLSLIRITIEGLWFVEPPSISKLIGL